MCNYALLYWGPTFFERVHQWPRDRTGVVLGLTTLGCGCAGLFAGGWLSDRWHRRGVVDAGLRVGLISLAGMVLTLAPAMLLGNAFHTVLLLVLGVFFIGLPIGSGYAAVQLIFPNQARGLVSAIIIFAVALIGLGLGAFLPGLFSDHLFHDGRRIGDAIALTVALACGLGVLVVLPTRAPYRADYAAVHGEPSTVRVG
jgi:MFS family permease